MPVTRPILWLGLKKCNMDNVNEQRAELRQILREFKDINSDLRSTLRNVEQVTASLQNQADNDFIHTKFEKTMTIGEKSVSLLIQLKRTADHVLTGSNNDNAQRITQAVDMSNVYDDFLNMNTFQENLSTMTKNLKILSTLMKCSRPKDEEENLEDHLDTTSTTGSDFSFINSNFKIATSSPLPPP